MHGEALNAACPFCGDTKSVALEIDHDQWVVECLECGAIGPGCASPVEAWYTWSYRKQRMSVLIEAAV